MGQFMGFGTRNDWDYKPCIIHKLNMGVYNEIYSPKRFIDDLWGSIRPSNLCACACAEHEDLTLFNQHKLRYGGIYHGGVMKHTTNDDFIVLSKKSATERDGFVR